MKLYKYLIIDDDVVKNHMKPYKPLEEPEYYVDNEKNNRIYFYEGLKEIAFMSFRYQNVKTDIFENYKPVWAYVIIDKNLEIINAIREHKNWSTDKDYKIPILPENETGRIFVEEISGERKYSILPFHKRLGGILGAGRSGKRAYTLQQVIIKAMASSSKKSALRDRILYEMNSGIKIEKIYQKGHTFDNRAEYLEPMTEKAYRKVRSTWEREKNDVYRPSKVDLWESYSDSLKCDCTNKDCADCNAVLRISTEQQLKDLIAQITGDEYKKLQKKIVSPAFYRQ